MQLGQCPDECLSRKSEYLKEGCGWWGRKWTRHAYGCEAGSQRQLFGILKEAHENNKGKEQKEKESKLFRCQGCGDRSYRPHRGSRAESGARAHSSAWAAPDTASQADHTGPEDPTVQRGSQRGILHRKLPPKICHVADEFKVELFHLEKKKKHQFHTIFLREQKNFTICLWSYPNCNIKHKIYTLGMRERTFTTTQYVERVSSR